MSLAECLETELVWSGKAAFDDRNIIGGYIKEYREAISISES